MVKKTEGKEPLLYQEEPLLGKDISSIFARIQLYIIGAWIIVIILTILMAILDC